MENIRVLVCGACGKMGQEVVRAVTAAEGMEVTAAVDLIRQGDNIGDIAGVEVPGVQVTASLAEAIEEGTPDVMVDFTTPESVYRNALQAIRAGVRPVIGATGLSEEQKRDLQEKMEGNLGGLIASNFAIGAILMMEFAARAARYMPEVEIIEYHHDRKLDAPSGTALSTAALIGQVREAHAQGHPEEKELLEGARGADYEGIRIHSVRLPGRVAHQEVIFGGLGQILTIRHDSINRESFMPGVVLAIRGVMDKDRLLIGLDKLL